MSYFFMINSNDCNHIHTYNTSQDFTTELPHELDRSGDWECGLREFSFQIKSEFLKSISEIYIFCDICEDIFVRNQQLPVLRRVQLQEHDDNTYSFIFCKPFYMKVIQKRIKRIRVYLFDENLQLSSLSQGTCNCTLHFRKRVQNLFYL